MEYARKTDFTSAACTEIYNEHISSQIDHHLQQTQNTKESQWSTGGHHKIHKDRKTHLRFPHNLAARANPGNEDEFLALRFFVVRISDAYVGVGSLGRIQFLLKFS